MIVSGLARPLFLATAIAVWLVAPNALAVVLPPIPRQADTSPQSAPPPLFAGRWDFIPVIAPDSEPAMVTVTPNGNVWIAGNGALVRRQEGESAFMVAKWADGRPDPVPAIISHDMFVLGDDRVLVSSIWRELLVAGPDGLIEVSPRGISGSFSFEELPDGRLAIGFDDWRIDDAFRVTVSEKLGRQVLIVKGVERLVAVGDALYGINDDRFFRIDIETGDRCGRRSEFVFFQPV